MLADILFVVNIVSAVLLVLFVLIQRAEGGLGALGGEGSNAMMGGGTGNNMTRITAILAIVFMGTSLWLAYETAGSARATSVIDTAVEQQIDTAPVVPTALPASGEADAK